MQKLFEIRGVNRNDYDSLKELWASCFDDASEVVNSFFEETATPENIIAAFDGNKAVGAVYIIESMLIVAGRTYTAYYVYGVCTHPAYRKNGVMTRCFGILENIVKTKSIDYLFLVPAEKSLFGMYEKLGFKTGIAYGEDVVYKSGNITGDFVSKPIEYNSYIELRRGLADNNMVVILGERGFNSFIRPVGNEVVCVYNGNDYAVFEKGNEEIVVHEWAGNRERVSDMVFSLSCAEKIVLRKPAEKEGIPFGMYRAFGDAPEIKSAFFGIPYGG